MRCSHAVVRDVAQDGCGSSSGLPSSALLSVATPRGRESNLAFSSAGSRARLVAIGTPAFRVTAGAAEACVFGYACGLDMTRRDLQLAAREKRWPWALGKDVEQSAIIGELVPASDIGHVRAGLIELRVNGATKQRADLSQMIHGVADIIAHLSTYYHLHPGDVIFTGTPEGVGPVHPGDQIDGSIAGVGEIAVHIGPAAAVV